MLFLEPKRRELYEGNKKFDKFLEKKGMQKKKSGARFLCRNPVHLLFYVVLLKLKNVS